MESLSDSLKRAIRKLRITLKDENYKRFPSKNNRLHSVDRFPCTSRLSNRLTNRNKSSYISQLDLTS